MRNCSPWTYVRGPDEQGVWVTTRQVRVCGGWMTLLQTWSTDGILHDTKVYWPTD
jgi:hypothetical protein